MESIPSNVVASPPLLERQVPDGISKHPAVSLKPLLDVDVAPEDINRFPPVTVTPLEEDKPPALIEAIPPANLEVPLLPCIVVVAVPPTVRVVIEENAVDEALTNLCSPVQSLA